MNTENFLTITDMANFLGLKYHHTRKLLLADPELKCYSYGTKRLWKLDDIEAFKQRHIIAA